MQLSVYINISIAQAVNLLQQAVLYSVQALLVVWNASYIFLMCLLATGKGPPRTLKSYIKSRLLQGLHDTIWTFFFQFHKRPSKQVSYKIAFLTTDVLHTTGDKMLEKLSCNLCFILYDYKTVLENTGLGIADCFISFICYDWKAIEYLWNDFLKAFVHIRAIGGCSGVSTGPDSLQHQENVWSKVLSGYHSVWSSRHVWSYIYYKHTNWWRVIKNV